MKVPIFGALIMYTASHAMQTTIVIGIYTGTQDKVNGFFDIYEMQDRILAFSIRGQLDTEHVMMENM